jgi:hypothetical protein
MIRRWYCEMCDRWFKASGDCPLVRVSAAEVVNDHLALSLS